MIRIGDFARLARVSVRTLRHYEAKELLRPAHVDARSRYRYYDAKQIEVLERLLLLRDVGLSLDAIRALLVAPADEFRAAIVKHREFLARQVEEQKRLLQRASALEAWLEWQTTEVCVPVSSSCRLSGVREIEPEPQAASIIIAGLTRGRNSFTAGCEHG